MGKPTYSYFNIRARGELPRLVAAAGKVDYVDNRLEFSDWPGDLKSKTPYGQIPALEVDGHWYAQKLAIALFFARKGGLYPTSGNPLETLKYDHALNFTEEVLENILQALIEQHFQKKNDKVEAVKKEVLPQKVPLLEKLLKENGTGYFVGDKLSIVDLSAFDVTEHIVAVQGKAYLDGFPLLKAHFERVGKNEEIKKHVAGRPKPKDVTF
jgi:glutathione S-transferase